MRASKSLFVGLVVVIFISFISISPVEGFTDDDWKVKVTPDRVEIVIGESIDYPFWTFTILPENTKDALIEIWYYKLNAPAGITTTPAAGIPAPVWSGWGWRVITQPFTIHVDPSFSSTDEQRLDFYFKIRWPNNEVHYKSVSLYVIPIAEKKWEVTKYDPRYASMENNQTKTISIGIKNYSTNSLSFDINAITLNSGFSLPSLWDSIVVGAGNYYEWTTTLTCTGYGLTQDQTYHACTWRVTNRESGTYADAGATIVKYIGKAVESVADLDIWWEKNYIEVPFGEIENVNLIMKNIGSQNLSFHTPGFLKITYAAISPVWIYDYNDPGLPVVLAPGENLTMQFRFWAQGDPETVTKLTSCIAQVTDNWGNVREDRIEMKAIVGTFSVKIRPLTITIMQGYSSYVYIQIMNNENANRNYIIDSMEVMHELDPYWATSNPKTENVEILAFGSKEIQFEITALGTAGIRSFVYYIRCDQTKKEARVEVAVEIAKPLVTIKPGVGGLLILFTPFTGGDVVAAGYLCSLFLLILPCTIVGLAISRGKPGLTVSIFGFIGIIMSSALGLIPAWIFIFILFIIALYLARGTIWGKGGG